MDSFFSHMKKITGILSSGVKIPISLSNLSYLTLVSIFKITSCFTITAGTPVIMTTFQAAGRKKRVRGKGQMPLKTFSRNLQLIFIGLGEEILSMFLFAPAP